MLVTNCVPKCTTVYMRRVLNNLKFAHVYQITVNCKLIIFQLRNPMENFTYATVKGSSVDMYFRRQVGEQLISDQRERCMLSNSSARIYKLLKSPGIDSVSLCTVVWRAGATTLYHSRLHVVGLQRNGTKRKSYQT
jgi:hypothetical protein